MTKKITLELPEEILSSLREDPESFVREVLLTAAVKWYEMGRISQEEASKLAGISRYEFIEALSRFKVSPFQYSGEEVREEIEEKQKLI